MSQVKLLQEEAWLKNNINKIQNMLAWVWYEEESEAVREKLSKIQRYCLELAFSSFLLHTFKNSIIERVSEPHGGLINGKLRN